jgi:subtilisin family serine protease
MPELQPGRYDVIVGFDVSGVHHDFAEVTKLVNGALASLERHGATETAAFLFRKGDAVAALGALVLDPQELTLARLQADLPTWNKQGIAWFDRNSPIDLSDCYDPERRWQWALDTLGVTGQWNMPTPTATTIVAIVDSGLRRPDGSLPEDIGAVLPVQDCQPHFVLPGGVWRMFPHGVDMNGHGTFLAGTIAALPCNGIGVASAVPADWGIVLMPIKFFAPDADPSVLGAAIAILWAAQGGARVINASWHVAFGEAGNQAIQTAIEWATLVGGLIVAAAGNDGTDNGTYPTWPANFGHGVTAPGMSVLTVAATSRDDWKATFSNYSPTLVDIAAPGQDIVTTGAYWIGAPRYPAYSGTSAAAAFASSAASLVFALNPAWTPQDVIGHLRDSADKLASLALVCADGNRLNIRRAVEGPLALQAPAEGAVLPAGQLVSILWSNAYKSAKLDQVKIEFSADDGHTWTTLVSPTPNDGRWDWTPTAAQTTDDGRVRVTPVAGNFPKVSGKFRVV